MDIECLISREGNSHVTMGGYDYVFKLNRFGRKVCPVLQEAHQKHFLSLKDFVEYKAPKLERKLVLVEEEKPAQEKEKPVLETKKTKPGRKKRK